MVKMRRPTCKEALERACKYWESVLGTLNIDQGAPEIGVLGCKVSAVHVVMKQHKYPTIISGWTATWILNGMRYAGKCALESLWITECKLRGSENFDDHHM